MPRPCGWRCRCAGGHRRAGERAGRRAEPQPRGDDADRRFHRRAGRQGCREARRGARCSVSLAALLLAVVQAVLSVRVRANQLVVGIGFNILALGATTFLYREIFGGLSREQIPSFGALRAAGAVAIPFLGPALFSRPGSSTSAFAIGDRHLVADDAHAVRPGRARGRREPARRRPGGDERRRASASWPCSTPAPARGWPASSSRSRRSAPSPRG